MIAVDCPECEGTGVDWDGDECELCNGTGEIQVDILRIIERLDNLELRLLDSPAAKWELSCRIMREAQKER